MCVSVPYACFETKIHVSLADEENMGDDEDVKGAVVSFCDVSCHLH